LKLAQMLSPCDLGALDGLADTLAPLSRGHAVSHTRHV
jgi:hypothetical protein